MNNTLTGLALALVLALVAALIGPYFINWSVYRGEFARQASELLGAPVTVNGAVDARLLPSPYVRFHDFSAGGGGERLTAPEVEITLALAPLMRGEIKAERIKLVRPRLELRVAADGAVRGPFGAGARAAEADRISFERAEIAGGTVALTAPAGAFVIDRIDGVAEAGSLKGPLRFEGSLALGGVGASLRVSTGRADAAGSMRIRANLAFPNRPELIDVEGALTVAERPRFEGQASVARPALRTDAQEGAPQPWRIAARIKADPATIAVEQGELAYGPEERALRLAAGGTVTLGEKPRFALEVTSRQVDLDRAAGDKRPRTPAEIVAAVAPALSGVTSPRMDGDLRLDIRAVVLAGEIIQDLTATLEAEDGGWRIEDAAARLPGGSPLRASGAIAFADAAPGFAGRVDASTADLAALRRWLSGGVEPDATPVRRAAIQGDLTARIGALALENARVTVEGAASAGRFAWRDGDEAGGRARLEGEMKAERIDLDAFGVDRLVASAMRGGGAADVALALDAKTLRFDGVEMRDVVVRGGADAGGVDIARLAIGDADGARISGGGRIASGAGGADGLMRLHVEAPRLDPLVSLARAFGAPAAVADLVALRAEALAPVALDLELSAASDGRRFAALGKAAGGALDARVETAALDLDARATVDLLLATPDGRRLAALAGLSLSPIAAAPGGEIALSLEGAPSKGMTGEARLKALGLEAAGRGRLTVTPGGAVRAEGDATLRSGDVALLGEALGRLTPGASAALPVEARAKIAFDGTLRVDGLQGRFADRPFAGRVAVAPDGEVSGALTLDQASLRDVGALALSPQATAPSAAQNPLPRARFAPSPLGGLKGSLDLTVADMALAGRFHARDARFRLTASPTRVAIEDFAATLDGGRLTGALAFARAGEDATANLVAELSGAPAEALLGSSPAASALAGHVGAEIELQGTGASIAALVSSATGAGAVTLGQASVRRLDPTAIDAVEPLVEKGLALEERKIAAAVEQGLARGDLTARAISAPFTISSGVVRSGPVAAEEANGRLGGAFSFDLATLVLDADLTLAPPRPQAPQIGVSFEGPLAAPRRRIDATALTSWLSVRAVERETERIERMEADIKARAAAARQRAEEERKRQEEAQRKAEAERRQREAEARAVLEAVPAPGTAVAPLPGEIDLTAPGAIEPASKPRSAERQTPSAPVLPPPLVITPR